MQVELAVFVDETLWRHFSSKYGGQAHNKLQDYMLTLLNNIQIMYYQPSASPPLTFRVIRYEVLTTQPASFWTDDSLKTGRVWGVRLSRIPLPEVPTTTAMLRCTWIASAATSGIWEFETGITPSCSQGRFARVLFVTSCFFLDFCWRKIVDTTFRYDIHRGAGSRSISGIARLDGMCDPWNTCTLAEGLDFTSAFIGTHELGHRSALSDQFRSLRTQTGFTPTSVEYFRCQLFLV